MQLAGEENQASTESLELAEKRVSFIDNKGCPSKLVGSLVHVPLPEVLQEISDRELSGDLQFIAKNAVRTLYFDHGFVVFAGSSRQKDRLGPRLIQAGKVSKREIKLAARLLKYKRRIGEAMVEIGILTEEDLGQEVARQVRQIILSLFSSKDTVFNFDERECSIPMELRLSLSIYRIQLEGVRRITNEKLILKGLGSLDRRVRLSDLPPFSFEDSELWSVERKVIGATEFGAVLHKVLDIVEEDRVHTLRALYGLLCAGILDFVDGAKRTLKIQEEMGTFLLSDLGKDSGEAPTSDLRQEVLLQFDSLEQASPFELLGIEESATEEEVQRAFEERQAEWQKKQTIVDTEKTLSLKIEEIKTRIARAHARVLAAKKAGKDPDKAVDSVDDEDQENILFAVDVPEEDRFCSDPGLLATESPTPEVSSAVAAEADSDTSQTGFEMVAARPPEAPSSDAPQPASQVDKTDLKRDVKRLLYDIKVRRAINDDEGAISLLYEIVELEPGSVKFATMLANALAEHPVMSKRAERHFRRALSLDPQNGKLHFSLGRYYQSFNMRSRALAEFKTALRIDPRHADARAALVELKENGGSSMDKFMHRVFG